MTFPHALARHCPGPRSRTISRLAPALLLFALLACAPDCLRAQTVEDGIMLSRNTLCTGSLYTHDSWDHYWEGTLSRVNGNIGTVTTQSALWSANYGLTHRINLIGQFPLVWTHASEGVLKGQTGLQDLTLAAKLNVLQKPIGAYGTFRLLGVVHGGIPLTNYTPDLMPLSIGSNSRTISARATGTYESHIGAYVNSSMAYTWRGNVTLDRSSYYTNGHLYLSNQVAMPGLFNFIVSAGYRKHDLMLVGNYSQQQTRGGGDIRRQDMPFVSNRMNWSKAGLSLTYPIPRFRNLQYWFTYAHTVAGRNVGESNTITTGMMYLIHFERGGRRP